MNSQPFWKDESEISFLNIVTKSGTGGRLALVHFSTAVRILILIVVAVMLYKSPLIMLAWIALFGFPIVARILMVRFARNMTQTAGDIQELAREKVGASHIGSAIHVAGHPLLERDQPVVLALVGDQLNVYGYDNSIALDVIPLKNIQALHTVSYDDDRMPYLDAIDSTAQALQFDWLWNSQPCTCLFRRMRKVKAVDWYHAIQKTRLQFGLAREGNPSILR